MVLKFGIFSGNIEHVADSKAQLLTQTGKESSSMFKFENARIRPVVDLPLSLGTHPHVSYTTSNQAASGSNVVGIVPTRRGYKELLNYQKKFLTHDGIFVWSKFGLRDSLLNRGLVGLCIAGVFGLAVSGYMMANGMKNSD